LRLLLDVSLYCTGCGADDPAAAPAADGSGDADALTRDATGVAPYVDCM
jgi:hypothetical protein